MNNRGIELRASTIDAVEVEDGDLLLRGVVWVRDPEAPDATGLYHEALIRIKDGVSEREELELPCLLEGGSLALNGEKFDEVLPLPLEEEGEVALLLVPAEASEFIVRGSGIEVELLGPQE